MEFNVPHDPAENKKFRKKLREWALKSPQNRKWLMAKCAQDFYFWLECFGWLYEPRPKKGEDAQPVIPFIPWPHQRPFLDSILENFGFEDVGVEKSRGEGATWCCLMIFVWYWLFKPKVAMGLVSLNEITADSPKNPDSLGAKIDWALSMLPRWMVGEKGIDWDRNLTQHTWINYRSPDGNRADVPSTIAAYACTANLATGGRKTAFMMDELAKWDRGPDDDAMTSTEPVTECRILISTYYGCSGAYYTSMHQDADIVKKRLFWQDNPTRNGGMFRIDLKSGRLLHPDNDTLVHTDGYTAKFFSEILPRLQKKGFEVNRPEKLWSPWYVKRCLRANMSPAFVAQEYDIEPERTGNRFFSPNLIERLILHTKEPDFVGDIMYHKDYLKVVKMMNRIGGPLKIWLPGANADGVWSPPPARYVVGGDIATGSGTCFSSNSSLSIVDVSTGWKVAEYTSPIISPEIFAEYAISLCRMFRSAEGVPAFLIWEANGPGGQFRDRVMNSDFDNVFYRQSHKSHGAKPTKEMGWWSSREAKKDALGRYLHALTEGYFANWSAMALKEAGQYTTVPGGAIEFIPMSSEVVEPSDAKDNHGDRAIADAMANFGMEHLGGGAADPSTKHQHAEKVKNAHAPRHSFLDRRLKSIKGKMRDVDEW